LSLIFFDSNYVMVIEADRESEANRVSRHLTHGWFLRDKGCGSTPPLSATIALA